MKYLGVRCQISITDSAKHNNHSKNNAKKNKNLCIFMCVQRERESKTMAKMLTMGAAKVKRILRAKFLQLSCSCFYKTKRFH